VPNVGMTASIERRFWDRLLVGLNLQLTSGDEPGAGATL